VEKNVVIKIRGNKEQPLIAIIGATVPTKEYDRHFGMEVGYLIRQHISPLNGTLFTGGVNGVGVDVYTGVMQYCVDELRRDRTGKKMPDDRFFVLVPSHEYIPCGKGFGLLEPKYQCVPFEVPEAYHALGAISERKSLDIVTAGDDLAERRQYLAHLADVLVAVNGTDGTLDEALIALQNGKPVITLSYSGGAALSLQTIKISPRAIKFSQNITRQFGDSIRDIDTGLIYIASNTAEMIRHLNFLL
jgi:hypothetical protein